MIHESASPAATIAHGHADGLTLRRVATLEEYQQCVAIQEQTWGAGFRELVPTAILMVAQKLGGVCAAAFTPGGRILGFVFGLTGLRDGALVHWSDLLAVRPEARGAGLGERLKRLQRDLVRAVGVDTMFWTFDPLVARNAHLNLVRLGARAAEYVPNMYGDNTGSPLHGAVPTDRFVARWDLARPLPPAVPDGHAANGQDAHAQGAHPRRPGLLVNPTRPDGTPGLLDAPLPDAPVVHVAVPRDLESLGPGRRAQWRAVTREAFLTYLERGYAVVDFHRAAGDEPPCYELARDAGGA
jgi:predicted GNAT superfamily acetyltransferase